MSPNPPTSAIAVLAQIMTLVFCLAAIGLTGFFTYGAAFPGPCGDSFGPGLGVIESWVLERAPGARRLSRRRILRQERVARTARSNLPMGGVGDVADSACGGCLFLELAALPLAMSKRLRGRAKSEITQPAPRSDWWVDPVIYLILILATLAVYAQVRQYDFVNFDDPAYVTQNHHTLKGLTADGMRWALTATDDANWFPMTWISLMADGELYGSSAGGYHITNVFLHILSALLLFAFLKRATGRVVA